MNKTVPTFEEFLNEEQSNEFAALGKKIKSKYSKKFPVSISDQFITIDTGAFDISAVDNRSGIFVEMDSDNPKKSKLYKYTDGAKILKVIETWVEKFVEK